MKTKLLLLAVVMLLSITTTAVPATADVLQVDMQSNGSNPNPRQTQSGWYAFEAGESWSSASILKAISYADATDGTADVTYTPGNRRIGRNYGFDNVTDPENLTNPDVWFDQIWGDGTLTITIDDLKAGTYGFTSYHFSDNLLPGVGATTDVFVNGVDTGLDQHYTCAADTTITAAQIMAVGTLQLTFTVANDNDTVTILFGNLSSKYFGMNGFELEKITQAYDPDPEDGDVDVEVDLSARAVAGSVSWAAPPDPNIVTVFGYDVYMDPNETKVLNATAASPGTLYSSIAQAGTSFDPGEDLSTDKTYHWRVDAIVDYDYVPGDTINDASTETGVVWSFDTVPSIPVIITQPQDQSAKLGETATFVIEASSDSPLTYSWYSSADDSSSTPGDDTLLLSAIDADSLEVALDSDMTTAMAADRNYYCVLSNASGTDVTSVVVRLYVLRKIAHYTFDGTADDSVAALPHHGTWVSGGEAYDTGVVGSNAAVFTGDPNSYIIVGTSAAPSSDPEVRGDAAGSASCWVKTTVQGVTMMATINDADSSAFIFDVGSVAADAFRVYCRGADHQSINVSNVQSDVTDGDWHHVVITWDTAADEHTCWFDAKLTDTKTDGANPVFSAWEFDMVIGAYNNRGSIITRFIGSLDDLQLFNYALSDTDVYDLFLEGPASSLCDVTPVGDLDENCVVNLLDVAILAAHWLDCTLYPQSECQ